MNEYFSKVEKYVDALVVVGKHVPVEDHIMYILFGLGPEYELMISVISVKVSS